MSSSADSARYHRSLTNLLGVMAYGELSAFERFSADARYSPTLHDRAVLGRIAVVEFQHYELVTARLAEMGVDVEEAMLPFQASVDHFHERTRPGDWYESLMKAYVIDTVSADFYRAVSMYVEPETRELIEQVQSADTVMEILRSLLKRALADDPRLASRLSLWGRRLLGEALTQAQRVGFEQGFLTGLMGGTENGLTAGGSAGADAAGEAEAKAVFSALVRQLAENHSRRMAQLGLTG